MKLFFVNKEKKYFGIFISAIILMLLLIAFSMFAHSVNDTNRLHEKDILQNALDRSITQCYALEGAYPPNVDYLIEHYGLTYDESIYFIDYQYIGANLRPDTTIIERD